MGGWSRPQSRQRLSSPACVSIRLRSTLSGSPDAADCRLLSQSLPLLPPAAGMPASAEWLALLKSQGPFVIRDGFWGGYAKQRVSRQMRLLARISLEASLMLRMNAAVGAMEFQIAAPSYRAGLAAILPSMTSKEEMRSAWTAFFLSPQRPSASSAWC